MAIEFVATFYTFNLFIELLLIPIITVLAMMGVMAETKPEWHRVHTLLSWVLALFGFYLLFHALKEIVHAPEEFATWQTLEEFYLPPLLAILLLPLLFTMHLAARYESEFVSIDFAMADKSLRRYAKWKVITGFGLRVGLLDRWVRYIKSNRPQTRAEIQNSISFVKELRRRERHPPPVTASDGWSPYVAKDFLKHEGLATRDYHLLFDEWSASSPYLELGDGLWKDNIAYYVECHERVATILKLVLHVNSPETAADSERRFQECILNLYGQAANEELPEHLQIAFSTHADFEATIGRRKCSISRDDNKGGRKHTYWRKFVIEHLA